MIINRLSVVATKPRREAVGKSFGELGPVLHQRSYGIIRS